MTYAALDGKCPFLNLVRQNNLLKKNGRVYPGETTRVARIIAMLLSIVITTCSLQLFTRQCKSCQNLP